MAAVLTLDAHGTVSAAGAAYELPSIALRRPRSVAGTEADAAAAFADFYRAEFGRLAGYCRALVGDESAARDLAQEALVRVFTRWAGIHQPRAYAYLVATNLAKRSWKRSQLERRAYERSGFTGLEATRPDARSDPALSSGAWLRELVEQLPDRHRLPVLLHYYADLAVADIARLLKLPAGTVKRRLYEARAVLAVRVGERP